MTEALDIDTSVYLNTHWRFKVNTTPGVNNIMKGMGVQVGSCSHPVKICTHSAFRPRLIRDTRMNFRPRRTGLSREPSSRKENAPFRTTTNETASKSPAKVARTGGKKT